MDSYYALGATSVLCGNRGLSLLYDFLCACIITDLESENKQPSLYTFTSFQPIPSFHNFLQSITTFSQPIFSSILSLHLPTIRTHRSRQGKRKKYCGHFMKKRADLKDSFSANQIGSMNFQRYFFPLDGGGGV